MKRPILRVLCMVVISSTCAADFVVAPTDRENQAGSDRVINVPNGIDYQMVFGSRNFSGPVIISALAFRLDEANGGLSSAAVVPRLQITVGTYPGTFETAPAIGFASPGPDAKLVFDGSVNWTSTDLPGGVPNPFDLAITFSQPFFYNPANGQLLAQFAASGIGSGGVTVDYHAFSDPTYGWDVGRSSFKGTAMIVTRFTVVPVPEPELTVLLIIGAVVICSQRCLIGSR